MSKLTVIVFSIFFASSAIAGGSIQLKGKVRSFDPKILELVDGPYIYKVDRRFIASVTNPKSGADISFWVPFNGITDIKKVK